MTHKGVAMQLNKLINQYILYFLRFIVNNSTFACLHLFVISEFSVWYSISFLVIEHCFFFAIRNFYHSLSPHVFVFIRLCHYCFSKRIPLWIFSHAQIKLGFNSVYTHLFTTSVIQESVVLLFNCCFGLLSYLCSKAK